jgi:hypothetical protein
MGRSAQGTVSTILQGAEGTACKKQPPGFPYLLVEEVRMLNRAVSESCNVAWAWAAGLGAIVIAAVIAALVLMSSGSSGGGPY